MSLRALNLRFPNASKPLRGGAFRCKPGLRSVVIRAGGGEVNGPRRVGGFKRVDMATLGNLCVDIVLNVPKLPPKPREERMAYMERLAASAPDKKHWEAGGNCNLVIAAARLGLQVITLGHLGDEIYGHFLLDVLQEEGIDMVGLAEESEISHGSVLYETLLCWVLVDPLQRHGFCSRADFSNEPAFSWIHKLSERIQKAIQQSNILFCNGYAFDELSPDLLVSALYCGISAGSAVFFDPGPRGRTLFKGTPEQQRALEQFLSHSDVILLTSDEAEALTGITNPIVAGRTLIGRGARLKWVIIKMGANGSILITKSNISCAPSFKVNVVDTVGCGDSFTAAIAYGYLHEMNPVNILALANAVGAATATGCGAGRNVASMAKVLEILRQTNVDDDIDFWSNLVDLESTREEVYLLSKRRVNGSSNGIIHVPIQTVARQLISKLDASQDGGRNAGHRRDEQAMKAAEAGCAHLKAVEKSHPWSPSYLGHVSQQFQQNSLMGPSNSLGDEFWKITGEFLP